jgi:hypothetical protein
MPEVLRSYDAVVHLAVSKTAAPATKNSVTLDPATQRVSASRHLDMSRSARL